MFKHFPTSLFLVFAFLGFNPIFAHAQAVVPPGETHLGCTLAWDGPVDSAGVSLWTDIAGFAHVTADAELWNPLDEKRVDDPTLRELPCEAFGIDALGTYTVGVRGYDGSLNQTGVAWLTFEVVNQDSTAPGDIIRFCLKGTLNGRPTEFCGSFDSPVLP